MKRFIFFGCLIIGISAIAVAQENEVSFSVEVQGVTVNSGTIYGALYSNNTYRDRRPEFTFRGNPTNGIMNFNLQIPQGEYVIMVYQDVNYNGQLDRGLFGIPKEPSAITNYRGGIPGKFDKHKVTLNNGTVITLRL